MKNNLTLTITSLTAIVFMTFHLAQDTLRATPGTRDAGASTLVLVPVLVLWLYGTLVLAERRSGHVIMLFGSLFALGMPVLHVRGAAGFLDVNLAKNNGDFLFVWTLHVLGVTGLFALILAISGLRSLQRGQPVAKSS